MVHNSRFPPADSTMNSDTFDGRGRCRNLERYCQSLLAVVGSSLCIEQITIFLFRRFERFAKFLLNKIRQHLTECLRMYQLEPLFELDENVAHVVAKLRLLVPVSKPQCVNALTSNRIPMVSRRPILDKHVLIQVNNGPWPINPCGPEPVSSFRTKRLRGC